MSGPASSSPTRRRSVAPREPLFGVAIALGLGIAAERAVAWPLLVWLVAGVATAVLAVVARRPRVAAAGVLAAWFLVGGLRGGLERNVVSPDDIARLVPADEEFPIRLTGRVATSPEVLHPPPGAPAWMQVDRTRFDLDVETLAGDAVVPASGRVAVTVDGHAVGFEPGDRISLVGRITTPQEGMTPGDFDFRSYLERRGVRRVVRSDHPDCVTVLDRTGTWGSTPARLRGRFRAASRGVLDESLSEELRPLAGSLLLGDRTELTDDLEAEFAASGTMHILAISGQHVMIFLLLLRSLCRAGNFSPGTMLVVLMSGVALYGLLTDQQPPVLRATLLAFFVLAGLPWGRVPPGLNAVGASAIALLLVNPRHLEDIGAQLSFLAVMAIVWGARQIGAFQRPASDAPDLTPERGPIARALLWGASWGWKTQLLTLAVWLFTLPLQMSVFHLASPIGFLINVPLSPLVVLLLGTGYLFLLAGLVLGPLVAPLGWFFAFQLKFFLWIVQTSAALPWGHVEIPGPPGWWLAGFYVGVFALVAARQVTWTRAALRGIAVWTIAGLAVGLRPAPVNDLTGTVLAVGHGGAILIEFPGGKTLLYDCGSMGGGVPTARSVRNLLWSRRCRSLDGVVLSHADADHFNALPALLESVPIGTVFVPPRFFDLSQPDVEKVCQAVVHRNIPLRTVAEGDAFDVGDGVEVRVLHPPGEFADPHDNAHSLALEVTSAGKRVLLTGDLERKGLERLLRLPPRRCDILLAPHHGGRTANPTDLARWAAPRIVLASCRRDDTASRLRLLYPDAETIFATGTSGAVAFRITAGGDLTVAPWQRPAGRPNQTEPSDP